MNLVLRMQITKGQVADYAANVAHLQRVKSAELAVILREIAYELEQGA